MNVLVVVDVQKQFDEHIQQDLVDAISSYAEEFDVVYQIWDTHNSTVGPTHSFPNQVDSVPKKFGKSFFSDKVKQFIEDRTEEIENERVFRLTDDAGYIVRVDTNHDWFFVNNEIYNLMKKIKDDHITLVGGAVGECLDDVYIAFQAFGLDVAIDDRYTYSAKTQKSDTISENRYTMSYNEFVTKKKE